MLEVCLVSLDFYFYCLVITTLENDRTKLIRIPIGEDALANLSIEQEQSNGVITGFVRIRSRSQGLALALGSLKGLKAAASYTPPSQ